MQFSIRRFAATALVVVLSSGGFGLCAGWQATAEARMACCADGSCPMHKTTLHDSTAAVTQAEADSCCASADRDDSTPSSSIFLPVIALGVTASPVPALGPPSRPPFDAWRSLVPLPGQHVPKHLLLSVFLI